CACEPVPRTEAATTDNRPTNMSCFITSPPRNPNDLGRGNIAQRETSKATQPPSRPPSGEAALVTTNTIVPSRDRSTSSMASACRSLGSGRLSRVVVLARLQEREQVGDIFQGQFSQKVFRHHGDRRRLSLVDVALGQFELRRIGQDEHHAALVL